MADALTLRAVAAAAGGSGDGGITMPKETRKPPVRAKRPKPQDEVLELRAAAHALLKPPEATAKPAELESPDLAHIRPGSIVVADDGFGPGIVLARRDDGKLIIICADGEVRTAHVSDFGGQNEGYNVTRRGTTLDAAADEIAAVLVPRVQAIIGSGSGARTKIADDIADLMRPHVKPDPYYEMLRELAHMQVRLDRALGDRWWGQDEETYAMALDAEQQVYALEDSFSALSKSHIGFTLRGVRRHAPVDATPLHQAANQMFGLASRLRERGTHLIEDDKDRAVFSGKLDDLTAELSEYADKKQAEKISRIRSARKGAGAA